MRRQNTNLDTDRHERDKTLNHLRTRVAVLEQELKDKQQVRRSSLVGSSLQPLLKKVTRLFWSLLPLKANSYALTAVFETILAELCVFISNNEILLTFKGFLYHLWNYVFFVCKSQIYLNRTFLNMEECLTPYFDD